MAFVVIFYAGNILVGKAINALPPFTIAFGRLFVAFVVLLPIGLRGAWKHRALFWKYKYPFLVMTLSGIALFNTFIYGALQFTSSTNVAVLEAAIPVVTVVLSAFMLKERLRRIQWVGIILSLIGATWVVVDGKLLQLAAIEWNVGDAIMLGAVFSWAIYSVMVKKYMHHFPQYAAIFVMTGISVMILLPAVLVEWGIRGIPALGESYFAGGLLYLGIFPSLIALIFYNKAVNLLGASQASVFLNFLPVVTMIGAYIWLGEAITAMQIIGTVLVISGVLLTTQVGEEQKKKKPIRRPVNE